MYVILVYDIGEKRVQKVCKYLRTQMHWVQNSVFEGEVTEAQLKRIKNHLSTALIDIEEDSVRFYQLRTEDAMHRELLGKDKGGLDFIL